MKRLRRRTLAKKDALKAMAAERLPPPLTDKQLEKALRRKRIWEGQE